MKFFCSFFILHFYLFNCSDFNSFLSDKSHETSRESTYYESNSYEYLGSSSFHSDLHLIPQDSQHKNDHYGYEYCNTYTYEGYSNNPSSSGTNFSNFEQNHFVNTQFNNDQMQYYELSPYNTKDSSDSLTNNQNNYFNTNENSYNDLVNTYNNGTSDYGFINYLETELTNGNHTNLNNVNTSLISYDTSMNNEEENCFEKTCIINEDGFFDESFFLMIKKKYDFNLYFLINCCCHLKYSYTKKYNIKLENKNCINATKLFLEFIDLKNLEPFCCHTYNNINKIYKIDELYDKNIADFIVYKWKLENNYKNLLIVNKDALFYREMPSGESSIRFLNDLMVLKLKKIKDILLSDKFFLYNLPEISCLINLASALEVSSYGRNRFYKIISVVFLIIEIKKDDILKINQGHNESDNFKFYEYWKTLLKIRTLLLIFYNKNVKKYIYLNQGIVICFMNFIIIKNWDIIKTNYGNIYCIFFKYAHKIMNDSLDVDFSKKVEENFINDRNKKIIYDFMHEIFCI